jgi:hypothetical protein
MRNVIKGNLAGYLCDDCSENISNVKILLYLPERTANVENALAAAEKETFKLLSADEIKAKASRLLGEAMTDELGNFEVILNEQYGDGALEFDFECGTVPRLPLPPKKFPLRQFHITTFYPKWDNATDNQDIRTGFYAYVLPSKWWCFIKGYYFDVWTICGELTNCETGKPLAGIKVIAMDADFLTDDELGSQVTDSNGKFKIYYDSAAFKKTFLSPLINIETDINFPFASGPDVYFQLEYNGQKFALETSANRRNNVGYCLCVRLCSKELIPIDPPIPPSFTHFGLTQHIPIQAGISLGKTLAGYAFFSSVNMVGSISKKINGNAMEYLFEYQEVANPTAALLPGSWLPVNPNMIDKTNIGYLWTFTGDIMNPVAYEPYYINGTGTEKTVNFNGNWIQVPQESNFAPHIDAQILTLNTEKITGLTEIDMAMPTTAIGSATVSPARPHTLNRFFAIRMRQRQRLADNSTINEAIAGTSKPIAIYNLIYNNVNQHGSWAPTTVDGRRIALSLDIEEIVSGMSGCSKITSALHIKYGARNENLANVSLSIVGPNKPGQSFGFDPIVLMATPETFGSAQLVFTPPTDTVNDLLACAYTVTIAATALLTTGDGYLNTYYDFVSFCKV